jgi:hypothetical protein
MRSTRWTALGLGLMTGGAFAGDICEPLREHIEFQIAGTGATGFAVIVVDADAEVAGKVVYVRASGAQATGRPARPAATVVSRTEDADIITECRDGTVVRGNASCKP